MPNCSKAMIGKLSKSESLRTVIEYVLKNDHSRLIACEGIFVSDCHNEEWLEQMISDFEDQTLLHDPCQSCRAHIAFVPPERCSADDGFSDGENRPGIYAVHGDR